MQIKCCADFGLFEVFLDESSEDKDLVWRNSRRFNLNLRPERQLDAQLVVPQLYCFWLHKPARAPDHR